jgi:WD40 repeat protein
VNYRLNEQQIAQRLIARNLPGLFRLLLDLKGITLNQRYTLRWLYAVGGQSIIYLAEDRDSKWTIIKLAFLPYHRLAYVSTKDIYKARQRLEREANLLQHFHGIALPEFCELIYAPNPLHSSVRGDEIVDHEPYLAMEFIQGRTLLEVARNVHRFALPDYDTLEWIAWQVAMTFTDFSITISEQEEGYLYSDLNPSNLMLTDKPADLVRILDAGSLIPLHPNTAVSPPFTWAYIPPEYYEVYNKGQILWPTQEYAMYTLGKTLWEVLTNRQPYPAEDPDLSEPTLRNYSASLRSLIVAFVKRQYSSFDQVKRIIKPTPVARQIPSPKLRSLLTATKRVPVEKQPPAQVVQASLFPSSGTPSQLTQTRRARVEAIQVLRYSPDGRSIAVANRSIIELWDAQTLHPKKRFKSPHQASVGSLDFDATGQYLVSSSREGICLWHVNLDQASWEYRGRTANKSVALNGRGELLAAVTGGIAVIFHPQFTEKKEYRFESIEDSCTCVAMAKRQPLLAVGGPGGIRLWDPKTRVELGRLRMGTEVFTQQIVISNREQIIVTLTLDVQRRFHDVTTVQNMIRIWDLSSHKLLWQIDASNNELTDIRIEPSERFVAASSSRGHLWIWDLDQQNVSTHLTDCGRISSLDFSPDGQSLCTATYDGELRIYHLNV